MPLSCSVVVGDTLALYVQDFTQPPRFNVVGAVPQVPFGLSHWCPGLLIDRVSILQAYMDDHPASVRATSCWIVALLLLCMSALQPTWSAPHFVNKAQGKVLYDSQAGLCGSAGAKCMGWKSATSIPCNPNWPPMAIVLCNSKGDVTEL